MRKVDKDETIAINQGWFKTVKNIEMVTIEMIFKD